MTLEEAIRARHSVRQYLDKPIEAEKIEQLQKLIDECNREGGLHIQLVTEEPKAFAGGMAKYGRFRGVRNYIAMIGKKGDDVNLGYYGEKVVLLAQCLGLNTCWVALTFKKQPDRYEERPDEKLVCVVSLGYGENQGVQHPQKKNVADVVEYKRTIIAALPDWFTRGIEAALLAPTAINQQKFTFALYDENTVEARTRFTMFNGYAPIDLGIAKCHFEIGAGMENFVWKDSTSQV